MTEHHLGTCFILRVDHSDVGGIVGDVARVGAVRQTDKAVLAPGGAPLVADLPVTTRASFHADGLHAVIHLLGASGHDAALVGVPGGSIQAHGERTGGLHVRSHGGLALDGGVAGDTDHELRRTGLAGAGGALVRGVRIGGFSLDAASLLHVVVGVLSPAALATGGGAVALHQLLRREDVGSLEGTHGVGLNLLGGREGPARTAVALVLHGSGIHATPILQACRGVGLGLKLHTNGVLGSQTGVRGQEAGLELGLRKVGESGDAVHSIAITLQLGLIAHVSDLEVLQEKSESLSLLLHGGIVSGVLTLEGLPHIFLVGVVLVEKLSRSAGNNGKSNDGLVDHSF
mmetsp:Transcript_33671/g.57774  ORF Transcript_33671/g.57774 Transcript_33671/m.57774 type:complete len:344 (+) Transcript_33671:175-1206(+)